jgi:RNA polymerase subunit RPABC4/transcription elongation factor Spt4
LALGLAIIFGAILYRKQVPDLFKVVILKKKRVAICRNCHNVIPKEYRYCGHCGTPKAKADIVVCDNCQSLLPRSYNYCGKCGVAIR